MLDQVLEHLQKEWTVIRQTPLAFIVSVILASVLVGFGLEWLHREKVDAQDQRIALLHEKIGDLTEKLEAQKQLHDAAISELKGTVADRAELRILFLDGTQPAVVSKENILFWHVSSSNSFTARHILEIVFDKQIRGDDISLESPDFKVPTFQIVEFNNRYAVINFVNPFPPGTLIVSAE